MKSCKSIFVGLCIFAISSSLFADNGLDMSSPFYMQDVLGRVSPQTAGIIKPRTASANLFSGSLGLEIPLYTIDDPDFTIPISLTYVSDGFRPRQHSEYCGHNWSLQAGGCVSRQIMNLPDECENFYTNYSDFILFSSHDSYTSTRTWGAGFLKNQYAGNTTSIMNGNPVGAQDHIYIYNDGNNLYQTSDCYKYDYMPDIFSFNCCGKSGKFIIGNDKKAHIIEGDFAEVDLSELTSEYICGNYYNEPLMATVPLESKIVITTIDGYKYTFGGNSYAIEFSKSMDAITAEQGLFWSVVNGNDDVQLMLPPVVSWYLVQVTAPNGRIVEFTYEQDENAWLYDEIYSDPNICNMHSLPNNSNCTYSSSLQKQVVLSKIRIPDTNLTVNFQNIPQPNHLYSAFEANGVTNYQYFNMTRPLQLQGVSVVCGTNTLMSCQLRYLPIVRTGNSYTSYRYLLSHVDFSNIGSFDMQYFRPVSAVPILYHPTISYESTEHVDYYGYVAGNAIRWGALSKVTFPTGGYQTFEYDTAHIFNTEAYYSFTLHQTADNYDYVIAEPEINHHRGLRIKNINQYDHDILKAKISYTYEDGVFWDDRERGYSYGYSVHQKLGWQYNPGFRFGYGKVEENQLYFSESIEINNRQRILYEFETHNPHANLHETSVPRSTVSSTNGSDDVLHNLLFNNGLYFTKSELASKIGKLLAKSTYKYNNVTPILMNKESYSWSGDNTTANNNAGFSIAVMEKAGVCLARRLYITPVRLSSTTTYDYSGSTSYTTAQYFSYDNKNRIIKKEYCNIAPYPREFHFEKYIYPDNICSRNSFNGYTDGVQYLVYTNQISKPIEKLSGYVQNNTYYLTSGQLITPVLTHPSGVWTLTNSVYQLALGEPINESSFTHISHPAVHQLSFDNRYQLLSTYTQNQNLQITSSTSIGDMTTFYTWNGIYLSSSRIGGHQTNYEVIPYVGVSKITDPRGLSTCYSYDEQGRVTEEYLLINGEKQIIKAYNYHYSNQ